MKHLADALTSLLTVGLVENATLEEAQVLADREINPNWWKVWR